MSIIRKSLESAVARLADEFAALEARQVAFTSAARELLVTTSGQPPAPKGPVAGVSLPGLLLVYERDLLLWALAATGGRQLDAARLLGIPPTTLNEKMKRLGITRRYRPPAA